MSSWSIGAMRRSRGFTMIELTVTLAVIGIAMASAAYYAKRDMYSSLLSAQGQQMVSINNGLQLYTVKNYKAIVTSTGVAGFANPMQPTIAELKTAKYLGAGFGANGVLGGAYNIRLTCVPSPCSTNSDIASVVYMTNPIYRQGTTNADEGAAAEIITQIGADGGVSRAGSTDHFFGPGGVDWGAASNPTNLAGVVAIRGGYGSSGWGQFLRLDGSTPMAGNLDMASNNVNNAATVNANRVVTAQGNGVQVGNTYYYGDSTNSAIRQNGTLYIQNQAGTGAASLNAGNTVVQGQLDASGNINSNGGSVYAAGEVTAQNWLRTNGDSGWYSNRWGGGWYMSDGTWVRAYGGKNVWTPGTMQADTQVASANIYSWGNSYTAGTSEATYLRANAVANVGWGCWPNGTIAQDGTGKILSCQSGIWQAQGGSDLKIAFCLDNSWAASCTPTCPPGYYLISSDSKEGPNKDHWADIVIGAGLCARA